MYWPEFLRTPFRKPGGLFGVGMSTVAIVFGVIAFHGTGVLVLVGACLTLLCIELWRDAARQSHELAGALDAATELRAEAEVAQATIEALQEDVATSDELLERIAQLELEAAQLRSEQPFLTPNKLLASISNQLALVEMVIRHHALAKTHGAGPWPVVRARAQDDGWVLVDAYVSHGEVPQVDEWLTLHDPMAPDGPAFGQVFVAGERQTTARFDPAFLSPLLAERLENDEAHTPDGLTLRLAGVALEPYHDMSIVALEHLRDRFVAVMDSLSEAVTANHGGEVEEPEE